MRDILIAIIAQMNASPILLPCAGFYGSDWYLGFETVDDKVCFGFKTIKFTENLPLNVEKVTLEWTCTKRNSQSSREESADATSILAIKKFNDKFKKLLKLYTVNGKRIFDNFSDCENEELYDSTMFTLPVLGYLCSINFDKIMDVKC